MGVDLSFSLCEGLPSSAAHFLMGAALRRPNHSTDGSASPPPIQSLPKPILTPAASLADSGFQPIPPELAPESRVLKSLGDSLGLCEILRPAWGFFIIFNTLLAGICIPSLLPTSRGGIHYPRIIPELPGLPRQKGRACH